MKELDHPLPGQVWLVAYDIADPKRLGKVAKTCLDYGVRLQNSLFECNVSSEAFRELWERLEAIIDPEQDVLMACPICRACLRRRTVAGRAPLRPPLEGFLF